MVVATAVGLSVAAAGIALLWRASRPPAHEPFRFPASAATSPTAEIDATDRARLEAVLNELRKTPGVPAAHR